MNDVYKRLVKEATDWCSENAVGTPVAWEWEEKFAELVVCECINQCNARVGNSDYNTGRMHCASDIKDHFGISN